MLGSQSIAQSIKQVSGQPSPVSNINNNNKILFLCTYIYHMHGEVHTFAKQKISDPLELELKVIMSNHVGS